MAVINITALIIMANTFIMAMINAETAPSRAALP